MIWALCGVAITVLSSVWWLRRLVADEATRPAGSHQLAVSSRSVSSATSSATPATPATPATSARSEAASAAVSAADSAESVGGRLARRPLSTARPHLVQSVRRHAAPQRRRHSPYTAVSIKAGAGACRAARELANLRFLEDAAPLLPLARCDLAACQCSLQQFADRRRGEAGDRREGIGLKSELYGSAGEPERRRRHGRRATDPR